MNAIEALAAGIMKVSTPLVKLFGPVVEHTLNKYKAIGDQVGDTMDFLTGKKSFSEYGEDTYRNVRSYLGLKDDSLQVGGGKVGPFKGVEDFKDALRTNAEALRKNTEAIDKATGGHGGAGWTAAEFMQGIVGANLPGFHGRGGGRIQGMQDHIHAHHAAVQRMRDSHGANEGIAFKDRRSAAVVARNRQHDQKPTVIPGPSTAADLM